MWVPIIGDGLAGSLWPTRLKSRVTTVAVATTSETCGFDGPSTPLRAHWPTIRSTLQRHHADAACEHPTKQTLYAIRTGLLTMGSGPC